MYRYALLYLPTGVVASRYRTKKEAIKAYNNLPRAARKHFEVVSIDDPRVIDYYEKVNRVRVRSGLKPIDPRYPIRRR